MDDTKYFEQALIEFGLRRSHHIKVGDLTVGELSNLLRRAQELKAAAVSPASLARVRAPRLNMTDAT